MTETGAAAAEALPVVDPGQQAVRMSGADFRGSLSILLTTLRSWPRTNVNDTSASLPSLREADRQKVGPHVAAVQERLGRSMAGSEAYIDRVRHKRDLLEAEMVAALEMAEGLGIRLFPLRGFATQAAYPAGYVRQFNDLDLVVPTPAEFGLALGTLRARGYFLARPLVLRQMCGNGGAVVATAALNKCHPELGEPIMLDLLLAGPALSRVSSYRIPLQAWAECTATELGGLTMKVLSPTDSLLGLLIECCERDDLVLRDLLDLDRLSVGSIDTAVLTEAVKELRLEFEVWRLRYVARRSGLMPRALEILEPLAPSVPPGLLMAQGAWRAAAEIRRARGNDGVLAAAARVAYLTFYPLLDRLEDWFPQRALEVYQQLSAQQVFDLGLPIYLFEVPYRARPGDGPTFDRIRGQDVVSFAGRCYLCRARPLIGEDEIQPDELC